MVAATVRPLRVVSVLLAVLVGLALASVTARPAAAHATLERTVPANGSVLGQAPKQIDLVFDEPVALPPQAVRLLDARGARVDSTTTAVDATVRVTADETLRTGSYVVAYRVVSDDGHPISGAFTFAVGQATALDAIPAAAEPSAALTATMRGLTGITDAALLLSVGLAVFVIFLLPEHDRLERVRGTVARGQRVGVGVALGGSLVLIPLLRLWQDAGTLDDLGTAETWAGLFRLDVVLPPLLVAAGLALVLLGTRRRLGGLVLGGGAGALASLVVTGHTRAYGPSWLSYPLDLVHVAAGSLWLGSIVGLTVVLRRSAQAPAGSVLETVSRFSSVALESTLVLIAAGSVLAAMILPSVADLVRTPWGIAFLTKISVVSVVLVVAAVNRWKVLPALRSLAGRAGEAAAVTRLRRTLRTEAIGLALVLAVTGVLTTLAPVPAGPAATLPDPTAAQTLQNTEAFGKGGTIAFTLTPLVRGRNTVTIVVRDADDRPLTLATTPTLQTRLRAQQLGPFDQRVRRSAPGTYTATVNLPYSGSWLLTYRIRLDKFTEATPQYPVDVP